jgi:hypothetical protein
MYKKEFEVDYTVKEKTNPVETSEEVEGSMENEKFQISDKDQKVGDVRSDSDSTDETDLQSPPLAHLSKTNSVPTSVMSQPRSGADLEKGPTGPQNNTVDDEGRVIVNWTSRTDPENPKNWPRRKKIFNVVIISMMTFLCPLSSSMFVRSSDMESANF